MCSLAHSGEPTEEVQKVEGTRAVEGIRNKRMQGVEQFRSRSGKKEQEQKREVRTRAGGEQGT